MPCGSGFSSSISPGALASGRLAGVWIPAHMFTELEVITVPHLPGFDDLIWGSLWNFPGSSVDKDYTCNEGDLGSIPGSGKIPRRRKWQPTPAFLLENPTVRGAWWATVHGVTRDGHDWVTKPPHTFPFLLFHSKMKIDLFWFMEHDITKSAPSSGNLESLSHILQTSNYFCFQKTGMRKWKLKRKAEYDQSHEE